MGPALFSPLSASFLLLGKAPGEGPLQALPTPLYLPPVSSTKPKANTTTFSLQIGGEPQSLTQAGPTLAASDLLGGSFLIHATHFMTVNVGLNKHPKGTTNPQNHSLDWEECLLAFLEQPSCLG